MQRTERKSPEQRVRADEWAAGEDEQSQNQNKQGRNLLPRASWQARELVHTDVFERQSVMLRSRERIKTYLRRSIHNAEFALFRFIGFGW